MHPPLRRTRHRVPDLRLHPLPRRRGGGQQSRRFRRAGRGGVHPRTTRIELNWIDERIGDHPYGVDIVIPNKYEGMDTNMSGEELAEMLRTMVPQQHLDFAKKILAEHGFPPATPTRTRYSCSVDQATATPQVEVALQHPKVTLIANALGTPPADMIAHIHAAGRGRGLVRFTAQAESTPRPMSTSSSPKAAKAAGTAVRWARSCCGPRLSKRSRPGRCWPPAVSAAATRSPRPGDGLPRRLDGIAVADGRGGREHPGSAGRLRQPPAATPFAAGPSPANPAACFATIGLRPGRPRQPRTAGNAVAVHMVSRMAVAA